MAKNKVQPRSDDLDTEEKPVVTEDEGEEVAAGVVDTEEEETLDPEEIDPFHDKWEE